MSSDILKIGIIGCGGIANGKHMPALSKLGDVKMVAFCDLIEEKARKAAAKYGDEDSLVCTDYRKLLEDPSIDVVHVLTPNRWHSEITVAALEVGKHVMCEKPMAINSAEAQKMLDAAKRTGRKLTIGYQSRQRADARYLKAECDAGTLGDIYYAKATAIRRRAVPTWGVFLDEYAQGGGPLIDIGTHALDLTLWMMNNYKPKMVVGQTFKKIPGGPGTGNAWGDWKEDEFTVEDAAFGFIVMENGAVISLESSWALNTLDVIEAKTTLCGTKAGADMRDGVRINGVKYGKQYVEKPNLEVGGVAFFDGASGAKPEDVEARVFYNAIEKGTPLTVLPEQALVVTEILEAIYKSAKTGKPVYFD